MLYHCKWCVNKTNKDTVSYLCTPSLLGPPSQYQLCIGQPILPGCHVHACSMFGASPPRAHRSNGHCSHLDHRAEECETALSPPRGLSPNPNWFFWYNILAMFTIKFGDFMFHIPLARTSFPISVISLMGESIHCALWLLPSPPTFLPNRISRIYLRLLNLIFKAWFQSQPQSM